MNALDHTPATVKSGDEPFCNNNQNLNFTLIDFWRWNVSDILSNATRGRLAEFIVATAAEIDMTVVRDEWNAYDLITPEGIKLEIKSAAYLQSWLQRSLSPISFSTKPARHWDSLTNIQSLVAQRHADVYVFCHLKHQDKQTVNPLNMDQWDFYILATHELNNYTRSQHSITLASLQKLTPTIRYDEISAAIKIKHQLNNKM